MTIHETDWAIKAGRFRFFRIPGQEIAPGYSKPQRFPMKGVELKVIGDADILVTQWEDAGMASTPDERIETVSMHAINRDPRTKNDFYYQRPRHTTSNEYIRWR